MWSVQERKRGGGGADVTDLLTLPSAELERVARPDPRSASSLGGRGASRIPEGAVGVRRRHAHAPGQRGQLPRVHLVHCTGFI